VSEVRQKSVWCALAIMAASCTPMAAGCTAPRARVAPFRVRPDSVQPGALVGPFDGKVVDASSNDPVSGAIVYATWIFGSGYGLTVPAGFHEEVTNTDTTGRYQLRSLYDVPESADKHGVVQAWRDSRGSIRLTEFRLVVYKRGYVAYRSDRRFSDFGPRLDFAQAQNQVALERWRSDFSHARHLRYVGGGAALASLTAWETNEAAAELSGKRSEIGPRIATDLITPRRQSLVAAQLLTQKEIKDATGFDGTFETGPLNDEPDTDAYSSQHFQAVGQPQAFDLAVRLWTIGQGPSQKRYARLFEDLPGVQEKNEIGDRSLRAEEHGFYGVAFLDARRGVVVLLTCGKSLCDSIDPLVSLGKMAYQRLRELSPATDRSGGTEP
jgi:hypothetical protein